MTTLDGHTYGPSVTLGGVDINLYDVTYAYTVLAGNGVMRGVPTTKSLDPGNRKLDPVTILQITTQDGKVLYPDTPDHRVQVQENQVVAPQYTYMIQSILSDGNNFCLTYGCGALSIGRPWGVKTGTSEPYANSTAIGETWTYGFTPDLVTGVWAGNADNSPVHNILSTSISYRAVRDFMEEALVDTPPSNFVRPDGLVDVDVCEPSGLKPTPACGLVVKNMLPKDKAPTQDDNWWSSVKVDIRDNLLATELTPSQFVQERRALTIPDSVQGFALSQAQEWAKVLGVGVAPTQKSTGDAPVRLDNPDEGATVSGIVFVTGKADSPDFQSYRVEIGLGDPPLGWTEIASSNTAQPGGGLATWNTAGLPDGTYTLRLVLEDAKMGELTTYITVEIGKKNNSGPTPQSTPAGDTGPPGRGRGH
jgi:hypothetical protein